MSTQSENAVASGLVEKLAKREAVIGILGMGYVGQPLALRYAGIGFKVLGFDIDEAKVARLNSGSSGIEHISDASIAEANAAGLECTTDFSRATKADALILCVPTPLNKYREPDLSYVITTTESVMPYLRPGHVLSLESTTYPGTTEEELLPRMEANGLTVGKDVFLVYSPEREDPGRKSHSTASIPKLVGGLDETATALAVQVYRKGINSVEPVASAEIAEAAKLLENIFRAVNIALVNEMKVVLTEMGIDVWDVVKAASTKPFGFMPFYPGPGLGGHCIPIDPFYLTWKAKEVGNRTRFIELAGEVNTLMPRYVVDRAAHALNDDSKSVKGASVLVMGLAYKPDVDDTRESPAFEIIELLQEFGAIVEYSDPHVPESKPIRRGDIGMSSVDLTPESLAGYDAVVIVTDHKAFDYGLVAQHAGLIIDSRNAMAPHADSIKGRLVKA